jgi:hypothetical protein
MRIEFGVKVVVLPCSFIKIPLAVKKHCPHCQWDSKNTFYQGILLEDELTIVRPPSGNHKADPQELWLLQCTL